MATKLPTFDSLMKPLVRALQALGGSGSIQELYDKVVELERFPDEVLAQLHEPEKSNQTEVAYRLAWARTYLKKYGLLENSARGIWSLNQKAREADKLDPQKVVQFVRALDKTLGGAGAGRDRKNVPDKPDKRRRENKTTSEAANADVPASNISEIPDSEISEEQAWKQKLHIVLTQVLNPAAFERLVQRVLRESGFTQVEVTGRSGDGGIDGRGIARIHGLMSFHVLFQCKRYKGSVGAGDIRDFRGAMTGRADKGLFIRVSGINGTEYRVKNVRRHTKCTFC